MRKERGITLIALIITIVVLLILAVVTVTSIQKDDVIAYANNAASMYNQSVTNEQIMLNEYVNFLEGGDSTPSCEHVWTSETSLDYAKSTCTVCSAECTHTSTRTEYGTGCAYGNGWNTITCTSCGKIVSESMRGCEDDGTGKCKYCGTTNNI